jgi:hypothetical protein
MKAGDKVIAINNQPLEYSEPLETKTKVAPPLILGQEYEIKEVILDSKGNEHLDVGIKSQYGFIRSFETNKELPRGDKIHWCHPSRFKALFLVLMLGLCSCAITGNQRYYNALTPCNIIVVEKRYVPGFTNPDKFLLKVRESAEVFEYRWLQTTSRQYSAVQIGDTIKTVLITQLN